MLSIGKLLWTFRLPCEKWFRTEENMTFSMRYTNGKQRKPLSFHTLIFPENACFQPLTPVNTLLYTRKMPMNKRKTSCLSCVNRAVDNGKWFVYLHLPNNIPNYRIMERILGFTDAKTHRKRTENVGFSVRKTRVNFSKMPRFPWIQSSFSIW